MTRVYKILPPADWAAARAAGALALGGADLRDGFVHLSVAAQLGGTLARYFADADEVVLVAFEAASFGDALHWETSREGALFPHLYGALRADSAVGEWRLVRGADRAFVLPALP